MAIDELYFQKLVNEWNQMIDSGYLREYEIIRFRQYIDILSDNTFNFQEKYECSIQIEEIIKLYRDVIIVEEENSKKTRK